MEFEQLRFEPWLEHCDFTLSVVFFYPGVSMDTNKFNARAKVVMD